MRTRRHHARRVERGANLLVGDRSIRALIEAEELKASVAD
jgi:hypothetical protein